MREWREADPDATAAEMARELGVTKERIRQILVSEAMPTVTAKSYRPASHFKPGVK